MNEIIGTLWEQIKPEALIFVKFIIGSVITLLLGKFACATLLKKLVALVISLFPLKPLRSMAWGLVRSVVSKHPELSNIERFNKVFEDIKKHFSFIPTSVIKALIESAYEEFRVELLADESRLA